MNSYFFGISGSWALLTVLLIIGVSFAVWTYTNTIPPISTRRRVGLITLRSLALTLLLFALFEPVFTMIRALAVTPKVAVMFDDSQSMAAEDAGGSRLDKYKKAIDQAALNKLPGDDVKYSIFESEIKRLSGFATDSLKFKGQATDISRAIRNVAAYGESENLRAAVIFTDGAYNSGNNPIFDAENLGIPVYVVGIGDTTEPKDLSVISLITNEVAYVDNAIPVNVNFKSAGYDSKSVKVSVYDNNNLIGEKLINVVSAQDKYSLVFDYTPKQEGIRKISAKIDAQDGEITTKNNLITEFVRVLKNKRNVSIFAGAPSADLSFIKQNLANEKGVELKEFIQKQGAEFYKTPTQAELNQSELIMLVGFPIASTPKSVIDMIAKELENGKPVMFVASQFTDYNKLKDLQNYLPFLIVNSKPNEFLALPDIKQQALSNPLLRVTGSDDDAKLWNNLPPLFRTETFVRVKPESEVVSTMKINNTALNEPLIVTRDFQNKKSAAFLGYGLYRWKLLGYAAEQSKGAKDLPDLFSILLNNSVRWLSVSNQNKLVSVRTTKKFYNQSEKVEFIGEVYDASYAPIDKANLSLKIGGGKDQRDVMMNPLGGGRYYASVEGLPEGDYAYNAEAYEGSRKLGSDNGRFSIGEVGLEYQNLKMNVNLLRTIAERTGGKFYTYDKTGELLADLQKASSFKPRGGTQRKELALWNLPWILGAALLFFSIEWFIRKRSGMI